MFVEHHTAGAATGNAPSLRICIEGRSDLRGPLCNLFMDRAGALHVVASGRANHAGLGAFRGVTGNSNAWGIEVEHPGRSPLDAGRVALLAVATAAIIEGRAAAGMVCQHHEWSSQGKIDIATNFHEADGPKPSANTFRSMVANEIRALADVTRTRIGYPTTRRLRSGAWERKSVVIPTANVDNWIARHPGTLERRGRGAGLTITPVAA